MTEQDPAQAATPMREVYSQRDNPEYQTELAKRTSARNAAFFLPHLRPGMRLLDVGCGPGTITVGLAEVVAPGEVVGIDLERTQVEQAARRRVEDPASRLRQDRAGRGVVDPGDGRCDAGRDRRVGGTA